MNENNANFTPAAPNFKTLVRMSFQGLTNFPYIEEDFDALTNYGLLSKVVEYLNEVISNNNEQNTLMTNLYNAYVSLQDYVNNYFDNLDVQDEINNKLDNMAQDGSLTALIKGYVDPYIEAQDAEITDFKNIINGQVNQLTSQVSSLASGSPKGVYATVAALESANPDTGVYIVSADGHIYSWTKDATDAIDLGVYQATSIDNNSITQKNLKNTINGAIITCTFDIAYPSLYIRFDNQTSLTKFKIKGKIKNVYAKNLTGLMRFQLLSGLNIVSGTITTQNNVTLKNKNNENVTSIFEFYSNDYREFELHNDELSLSNINGFLFGLNTATQYHWDYYLKDIEIYVNDVKVDYYLENGSTRNPASDVSYSYDDIDFLQTHSQNNNLLVDAINLYHAGTKSNPRVIACWGDSLTEGTMPSGTPYPTKLSQLINDENVEVVNLGVNGNSSGTIGVRQGSIKLKVASNFTIPATTTAVECEMTITNANGNTFRNVTNIPVIINNIKGTLVVSSVTDSSLSCTFTREESGSETSVTANTDVLSQQDNYRSDTTIFWVGRNDDVNYGIYLINNINTMVNYLNTQYPSYLVVSITLAKTESSASTGTGAFITRHNEVLKRNFKNNYVDLNSYLVNQCIYDLGLTPTESDLTRMAAGAIPEPLFADSVHFTDATRQKIAEYLYNELLQRHYIY